MKHEIKYFGALFNISFDCDLGRGDRITDDIWITNNKDFLKDNLLNSIISKMIGEIEVRTLLKADAYVYATFDREIDLDKREERLSILNKLIMHTISFLDCLWLLKDNAANMELAFLEIKIDQYQSNVSSNSWTHYKFDANGNADRNVLFCREEIRPLREFYRKSFLLPQECDTLNQYTNFQPYGKSFGNISRAFYFLSAARTTPYLPVKIAHYCSCLETLFFRVIQELSFKLPLRVACFLSDSPDNKLRIFKQLRNAYNIRSTSVHGLAVKPDIKVITDISCDTDQLVRLVINKILKNEKICNLFNEAKDVDFNEYMEKLIFKVTDNK